MDLLSHVVGGAGFLLGGLVLAGFGAWASFEEGADGLEEYFFYVGAVVSLFGLMLLLLAALVS